MNMHYQLAVTAAATLAVCTTGQAAVLVNGSFETATITTGTNIDGPTTENGITGWTVEVPVDARSRYAAGFFGFISPSDGSAQFVFNNGDELGGSTLSQTFATIPGTPYEILFDSGFVDTADQNSGSVSLLASVDTALGESQPVAFDISGDAGTNGSGTYTTNFALSFVADSATTSLTFLDTTSGALGNGADIVLDNVRITVVPEPTAAFGLAGGMSGLLLRRRSARIGDRAKTPR